MLNKPIKLSFEKEFTFYKGIEETEVTVKLEISYNYNKEFLDESAEVEIKIINLLSLSVDGIEVESVPDTSIPEVHKSLEDEIETACFEDYESRTTIGEL